MGHSISPAIHGAAYAHHGIDASYELIDCADAAAVAACFERVRSGELAGVNVTVPHKRTAIDLADEVDASARATGAANVIVPEALSSTGGRRLRAYNTDAPALQELLSAGCQRSTGDVVVLGNGGAALASVVAARAVTKGRVFVSARRWQADAAVWPARAELEALGSTALEWSKEPEAEFQRRLQEAAVIVQATSVGMAGTSNARVAEQALSSMVPWQRLQQDAFVYDVVYTPPDTLFLNQAKAHQVRHQGGLPMLVGQAALAFELWMDRPAPRAEMAAAAQQALFGGSCQ